jgi:hypothetical protein
MPYQPFHRTQNTGTTAFGNLSTSTSDMPLSTSIEYARQAAELPHPPYPPAPCQVVRPASAEDVGAPKAQIQDLRTLAQWLRLHDPTLPPPIVGDIESDPRGIADRYGVKGKTVLSSFFDMDELSCRVCAFKAETTQLALLHQQQECYLQLL